MSTALCVDSAWTCHACQLASQGRPAKGEDVQVRMCKKGASGDGPPRGIGPGARPPTWSLADTRSGCS